MFGCHLKLRLNMSPTERKVLVVLTLFLILGIGVRFYQKESAKVDLRAVPTQELEFVKKKFEENRVKKMQVDLNSATAQELEELPGIGPKLAQEIILHREKTPFAHSEDVLKIKGFGKVRYGKLRSYLLVNGKEGPSLSPAKE